ncbi:MAG: hypothetical protein RLY87_2447 [Chloroflexota bacterium]
MFAHILSCAIRGLDGAVVTVEVDIAGGLPSFTVVGLADTAVQESRERVRAAIRNSGYTFPMRRVAVSLAPADMRKGGPAYDLPIAVAILLATQQLLTTESTTAFLGELGFDGTLRSTDGMLPMVIAAREAGMTHVVVPQAAAAEAALVQGIRIVPCTSLRMVAEYLEGSLRIPVPTPLPTPAESSDMVDFADVRGNQHARRALEVVASGGHNILLTGAPGSGKTMMARALWGILPLLTPAETLEVAKIRSVAGMLGRDGFMSRMRPFCAPHHTSSLVGLVGGGANRIKPGMVTLAHRGVLFLDELPEYGSKLEVLRQPLEDRSITISRAHGSVVMPANLMLVAARNPCPCGWRGDRERVCTCRLSDVERYAKRVSGPILDRIDMHLDMPRVAVGQLLSVEQGESTAAIRARVAGTRQRQYDRQGCTNADMTMAHLKQWATLDDAGSALLARATEKLLLSARAYYRMLRVARTIADIEGSSMIRTDHIAEALQYRGQSDTARTA